MASLKSQIEDNLVLSVLGLLFAGAVVGFGAAKYALPGASSGAFEATPFVEAQVDSMRAAHDARLDSLQQRMLDFEKEATDLGHIEENQQIFASAASRIQAAIAEENRAFTSALRAIRGLRADSM